MAKKRIIAAATLAAGIAALYKIGEEELKRRANAAESEKDLDELFSEFDDDAAEGAEDVIGAEGEYADLEINESYDDESIIDMLRDGAAVVKVGLDVVVDKVKDSYDEYKEDPEAFKEKAKEFAQDKAEEAKDFASDKYEYAKDFAAEKFETAKDAAAEKFEEAKDYATEKYGAAKDYATEKYGAAKDYATEKVENAKTFAETKIKGLNDIDFDDELESTTPYEDESEGEIDIIDFSKKGKKKDKKKK